MINKQSIQSLLKWVATIVVAVGIVMVVRLYGVESYRVSTEAMEEALHRGDYILVNKLPIVGNPGRNRVAIFTSPLQRDTTASPLFLGRCIGMPGDTIEISKEGYRINGTPPSPSPRALSTSFEAQNGAASYTLVVPRKDRAYRLNAATLTACKEAILKQAGSKAVIRDGKLYMDGRETSFFFFNEDYYWMLADNANESVDSRHLGFIPRSHVIGNTWFCWYSLDAQHLFKPVK